MITNNTTNFCKNYASVSQTHLEYLPGKIVIRIREAAIRPHLNSMGLNFVSSEAKRLPEEALGPLNYLRRNAGLKHISPLFSTRLIEFDHASVSFTERNQLAILSSVSDSANEDLTGFNIASIDNKTITLKFLKHLKASKIIELVEPLPARWLAGRVTDPKQNMQWGLRAIKWFNASIPIANNVRVAVLDTGVDITHPDLKSLDIKYYHRGLQPEDIVGHGTHICGIISAITNNKAGITGIACCKLIVWKIFPDKTIEDDFYVDAERYFQTLNAVIESDVKIVNLSIGGTARSQTEAILIQRLINHGINVVAAMGNDYNRGNPTEYPAAHKGVLAVGSVAENLRHSFFSNTGKHIGIVAPGSNILSTLPLKQSVCREETMYAAWSGTSMATPHVSAAATLVASRNPTYTAEKINKHLRCTTTQLQAMKRLKWTETYGSGLLNLKNALS